MIIPQPSYVSYVPCTVLAGGTPVIVELKEENDFISRIEHGAQCDIYSLAAADSYHDLFVVIICHAVSSVEMK